MSKTVSKSRFKAKALEYFREVERTGQDIVITDKGKSVLRVTVFVDDAEQGRRSVRGSVIQFEDPTDPVGLEDWEALR